MRSNLKAQSVQRCVDGAQGDMNQKLKVIHLEWDGDHDAFASGFRVTLECGHTFWRPTNIIACRGIEKSLKTNGAYCPNGCKSTTDTHPRNSFI